MNSDYETISLHAIIDSHPEKELLLKILSKSKVIAPLLDAGCYIAGGFGRALLNGSSIEEYLMLGSRGSIPGDIDIFYSDETRAEEFQAIFSEERTLPRSWGQNALESYERITCAKIQLVDRKELILPVEVQLDRFDFTNAAVAITKDQIIYHKRFKEIEEKKLLDVKNSISPFLASRIMKYISHRGLTGVTPESEPQITDWLIRMTCEDFNPGFYKNVSKDTIFANMKTILANESVTRTDDLMIVFGKFKYTYSAEPYGPQISVDFALNELKKRGQNVSVPKL
jgi:hypothetical protein